MPASSTRRHPCSLFGRPSSFALCVASWGGLLHPSGPAVTTDVCAAVGAAVTADAVLIRHATRKCDCVWRVACMEFNRPVCVWKRWVRHMGLMVATCGPRRAICLHDFGARDLRDALSDPDSVMSRRRHSHMLRWSSAVQLCGFTRCTVRCQRSAHVSPCFQRRSRSREKSRRAARRARIEHGWRCQRLLRKEACDLWQCRRCLLSSPSLHLTATCQSGALLSSPSGPMV